MTVDVSGAVPRERLAGLLAAVASICSDLDLEVVLNRVAQAAADLVEADYAAVGVFGGDGELDQFVAVGLAAGLAADEVTVGLAAGGREPIGSPPPDLGSLGQLALHGEPQRFGDLRRRAAWQGFAAAHHPPMQGLVGVPLRVRDQVLGNLYVADKRGGEFDEADESLLVALAAAVGVTVQNARLLERSQRRERAAAATAEITTSLLAGAAPETVLELAAERAGDLIAADVGVIALPHGERLLVEVSWGAASASPTGTIPRQGPLGGVLEGGRAYLLTAGELARIWPGTALGQAVAVPLGEGVCVAARRRPAPAFTTEEVSELTGFAAQATVALELAQRRRDGERLSVYADRDRIGRDLHDLVIQRLFATGMQLESVLRQIGQPVAQTKVRRAVGDLDETIREIRSTIYSLSHAPPLETSSLRVHLLEVVDAAEEALGFPPSVRLSGLIDTTIPADLADDVVCVLREALTNVVRHAQATAVSVEVEAFGDVLVRVVDDGTGLRDSHVKSGLQNLAERAELAQGRFFAVRGPRGGTEVLWRVPLP